ncbi:enoyl-CoA hydratase [Paraburkholderia phymatum]|uniref:enoyl-CoA hydratase n=1 Tax=Paraburkholderia TaxID=1822464 RepID=UPI003179E0BA
MIELEYVQQGARQDVALITLQRPPVNAFTQDGLLRLKQTIERLNGERDIRAIVITGGGPRFFSAGADLNTFSDGRKDVARVAASLFGSAFETLQEARPVVIAAINGYAMGGGLECALACDIRIAEAHAQLALPETAVGLLPCGCGTQTLPWLVGEGWAKRMMLTGERIDAATALRIGLVEEVVEQGAAREAGIAMGKRVARLSPLAVTLSKQLIHEARNGIPRRAALTIERERFVDLFDDPDQREGVNAFLEKRSPRWHRTGG